MQTFFAHKKLYVTEALRHGDYQDSVTNEVCTIEKLILNKPGMLQKLHLYQLE